MSEDDTVIRMIAPHRPLTPRLKAELEALAAMPDEMIDTSDIPPLDEKFWRNAVRNPFYRKPNELAVNVDAEIVDWLGSDGDARAKLLSVLKEAMDQERSRSTK